MFLKGQFLSLSRHIFITNILNLLNTYFWKSVKHTVGNFLLSFNFSLFDVCFQNLLSLCTDNHNNIRSPNPNSTFILKSTERIYYLLAPSIESMRIWFDVLATEVETFQNI